VLARTVRARRVWLLYEFDVEAGYPVDREYYGSLREALKALEDHVKTAEEHGWECYWVEKSRVICKKCDEETGECHARELGVSETYA
jgi:hypothetical protein